MAIDTSEFQHGPVYEYFKGCYERMLSDLFDKVFWAGINGGLDYDNAEISAHKAVQGYFGFISDRDDACSITARNEAAMTLQILEENGKEWDQVWDQVARFDDGTGKVVRFNYESNKEEL